MKAPIALIVPLLALALLLSGCTGFFGEQNPFLWHREGKVQLSEIGGSGLVAVSPSSEEFPVGADGSFYANLSKTEIASVVILDSDKKLRAYSVSVPNDPDLLVIGADSTAKAMLFKEGKKNGLETLWEIGNMKCYPQFAAYIKSRLPQKSINELTSDPEFLRLLSECKNERAQ